MVTTIKSSPSASLLLAKRSGVPALAGMVEKRPACFFSQAFMPDVLPKIRTIRDYARSHGHEDLDILVDGGIALDTAAQCAAEGANVLIAGTSLYGVEDMTSEVSLMRQKAAESLLA